MEKRMAGDYEIIQAFLIGDHEVVIRENLNAIPCKLLFVTKQGMMKLVDTSEFEASKKTVAATKLADGDSVAAILKTDATVEVYSRFNYDGSMAEDEVIESSQNVVVRTENGVFLKFPLTEIPQKKKNAVGVRGIKLVKDDTVDDVYLIGNTEDVSTEYCGKTIDLGRMKLAHRDTKGTKVRV